MEGCTASAGLPVISTALAKALIGGHLEVWNWFTLVQLCLCLLHAELAYRGCGQGETMQFLFDPCGSSRYACARSTLHLKLPAALF